MASTLRLLLFTTTLLLSVGVSAAITYQGAVTGEGNSDNASLTVPGTVLADDLLLVQITIRNRNGSDGVTAPAGWTQIGVQERDNDVLQSLYYRVATPGEAGTTVSAPSVTTVNTDSMLVGFYTIEAGSQSFAPPPGMTEAYDEEENNTNNGLTSMAAYQIQVATGATGTRNATSTRSNDDAIGALVALNPASVSSSLANPVADWRFDELSWNGTAGEVTDSSSNGLAGTAENGAAAANFSPALTQPDGTSTCGYGEFDGTDDSIALGNPGAINFSGQITLSAWIRPDRSDGLRNIFNHGHRFSPNQEIIFRINNGRYQAGSWNGDDHITSANIPPGDVNAGNWVHLASVYDGSTWHLYRNGVEIDSNTDPVGAITVDENWAIAARGTGTERFFDGGIDEVRIYNTALTATQIQAVMNETRSCPVSGPDHYSITAVNGVACENIPVTVSAHDLDGNLVDGQGATVTLTTSTGRGTWIVNGVADSTPGNGRIQVSFGLGDQQITNLQLSYPNIDTTDGTPDSDSVFVTVDDGSVNNDNSGNANNHGISDRPESTIALSGFRFINADFADTAPEYTVIPDQVAGVTSSQELFLRAIRTDTDTGACTSVYPDGSTVAVGFAAEYQNPANGTRPFNVDGVAVNTQSVAPGSYDNVNLQFEKMDPTCTTNCITWAPLSLLYNDVGQLQLHARDVVTPPGGISTTLLGSSTSFVVRPHHFAITANGNLPAGTDFNVTVTAQRNGGGITPNYGNENSPEGVTASFNSLELPVGGNNGALSTITPFTGSNGVFSGTLNWSEVGTLTLIADVASNNYLNTGAGVASPTLSGDIGRFYPADFVLGSDSAQDSCGSFSYLSHPAIAVAYTITARNTSGVTVSNYDSDSDNDGSTDNYPVSTVSHRARQGATDLTGRLVMAGATWNDGVYVVDTDSAAISRSSNPEAPFGNVQLSASISGGPDPITVTGDTNIGDPLDLRFGRARIDSVHGPESSFLNVPFGTEYWNGSQFVASVGDSCTAIAVNQIQFDGALVSGSPENVDFGGGASDGTFFLTNPNATTAGGTFGLVFSPPGAGNTGSFPVRVNLTNYPWLRFDWNQDDSYDDTSLPDATISFEHYRGHDRVIYWRERFD